MHRKLCLAINLAILIVLTSPAQAGSGLGHGIVQYKEAITKAVLEFGEKIVKGVAEKGGILGALTSKTVPSATGAVGSLIEPTAKIAVELAITDYKVSRHQQQQIREYAPLVRDAVVSHRQAVDFIMASNYTSGAGKTEVNKALDAEVQKISE